MTSLDRAHARTSRDARRYAGAGLSQLPGFVAPGAGNAMCDWFVIGGRASGLLTQVRSEQALHGTDRIIGSGPVVTAAPERNPYRTLGDANDAQVVDQTLFDTVLAGHAGQSAKTLDGALIYRDLDGDPVNASFIDRKWLVVVDCHS